VARDSRTFEQAAAAAKAWAPTGDLVAGTSSGCADPGCLCTTNGPFGSATRSAVFCYSSPYFPAWNGLVAVTETPLCGNAACPSVNAANTFQWH
jgi:hypothetical protein